MYSLYKDTIKDKAKEIGESCKLDDVAITLINEIIKEIQTKHPEYSKLTSTINLTNEQINNLNITKHSKLFITNHSETLKVIQLNKEKARQLYKVRITLVMFNYILVTFNRLLWKRIADYAYVFRHTMIGSFYIVCRENATCKPRPNWVKTKENKENLLSQGLKPRYELEAREAAFKGEHYDGVPFVERFKPFNLAFKWKRSKYANFTTPEIMNYNMEIVRSSSGKGFRDYLKRLRDENNLEDLLIKYHKPNA